MAFLKVAAQGQTTWMQRRFLSLGEKEVHRLLDYSDGRDYTALHLAAMNGFKDTVEALLAACAAVSPRSVKHVTPLHLAAITGRADIVDLLLENCAVVDHPSEALGLPLHCAAFSGNRSIFDALTRKGASLEASAKVSLPEMYYAVSEIPPEDLDKVLDTARVYKCQPFIVAILMKSWDIMEKCMDSIPCIEQEYEFHRTGYNFGGITPSMRCAGDGFVSFCEELMRKGASRTRTTSFGWNAVTYAAFYGHTACLKALLDHPGDDSRQSVRNCDNMGWTPLMHAASEGEVDTVQELLQRGVDVDQPSNRGNTRADCFFQPSEHLDWWSQGGFTALHMAAHAGRVEIVKKLVDAGASWTTEAQTGARFTPVDAAKGNLDVLALCPSSLRPRFHAARAAFKRAVRWM